jgi:hypothetical protein
MQFYCDLSTFTILYMPWKRSNESDAITAMKYKLAIEVAEIDLPQASYRVGRW